MRCVQRAIGDGLTVRGHAVRKPLARLNDLCARLILLVDHVGGVVDVPSCLMTLIFLM